MSGNSAVTLISGPAGTGPSSYQWSVQGGTYTDTLGNTALTVGHETLGSDGAVAQFGTATYTYGSDQTATVTPHYTNMTIATNFGCSSVAEYAPGSTVPLIDSITMADGRKYSFTYETGAGSAVTGRIASITLAGGGTITYAYTKVNGVSINCSTGAPLGFIRTVTDGEGNSNKWTYAWVKGSLPITNTTTVTDPTGASTVHTFAAIIGSLGPTSYGQELVETSVVSNDSSGHLLKTVSLTYNGAAASASNPTYPVTSIQSQTTLPSSTGSTSVTSMSKAVFNTLGQPTETDVYDFGTAGGTYGSLISKTVMAYASLGQEYGHPSSVITYGPDGSTVTAETTYGYDQTAVVATSGLTQHQTGYNVGNVTTVKRLISSAANTWLTSTATYNDTGTVATSTDVNGAQTTYNYNECNGAFPGSSSTPVTGGASPVTFTTSATWNCVESTMASTTDLNGNVSTATYADPYDRPTSTTDAFGNETTYVYPTAGSNISTTRLNFNGNNSTNTTVASFDGLGRTILQQNAQGPSGSNLDSVAISYNSIGLANYQSLPYSASYGTRTLTGPGIQTTYDGIGRPLQTTDSGGGTTTYGYSMNDVTVTTGPAPSGETVKVKVLESDGSGALKSVCEVNALAGSGACAQSTTGNSGYFTKYTTAAGTFTVQQNVQPNAVGGSQTRTVNYDLLGRTTSETIPELGDGAPGTMTYKYDADTSGTCSGTYSGDLVYKKDAAGNITCYAYDSQHRMLSSNTVSGPQSTATAQSRFVYDVGGFDGTPFKDALGTGVEAYTCASGTACTTKLTDVYSNTYPEGSPGSYTGRTINQVWQWSTNSGGYYTSQATSYPNGARANFSMAKYSTSSDSTATVTITGTERNTQSPADEGLVVLQVNGIEVQTQYNTSSTTSSVAGGLAAAVNASSQIPVTAIASGSNVLLTSKTAGANTNYPVAVTSFTTLSQYYNGTSFPATAPAEMAFAPSTLSPELSYTLDEEGRPVTVTDGTNALNLVTGVTYNAASQATAVTYGNGDSDTFTPDPNTGRITGYKNTMTGSGAFVDTGTLGWNANGSLGSFQWVDGNNSARNQSCTYAADAVNRIVSANCGSAWAQTFSYDAFGNVFKAGSSTYSPSSYVNNQPVSGVTATYDANGNQTMTTLVASLTYDANHHPVTAGSTAMLYDAFGRLVEAGGKAVVYGPAGEKLGVFNGSAYTESFLLPGGSEAYYTSGALTSLRRKDWLGSSRVATSWSHAVVSKAAYAPFGESYSVGGTTDLDFTGQTQDSVSSLYDFPARKYDPGAGRWTVPDPGGWSVVDLTNPQSFNRYAYVLNMPLVFIDPSGMDDPCVDDPTPACTITVTADPPPPCYEDASCAPPDPPLTTLLPYQPTPVYGGPGGDPNNVNKQYGGTFPCSSTAGQVMGAVESNFAAFGNYSAGPFGLAFHQPPQMGAGSEIAITATYFGVNQNMGVSVTSMSSSSMSFSTLPGGHLFYPGAISFSASQAGNGMVSFNINLSGNFNGVINGAKYYLGGSAFENAQWNHFLSKVQAYCSLGG